MTTLKRGYRYQLHHLLDPTKFQDLQFVEMSRQPGDQSTHVDGTTNEEMLKVMIDRLKFQYDLLPSAETQSAIAHLESALALLNSRTANRKARQVEGTDKP